ncbi:MAG: anthranilate phosphoribosyltransferase [Bdellovibrionales bacterium]|nr:anthranilate phosphoribosyltransferase [Bdellovibrionales bacterium]
MDEILTGKQNSESIAAFLGSLSTRGETPDELAGFIDSLWAQCPRVDLEDQDCLDVCGTGGDHSGTFNISTASGLVLASCGVKVAKHGNRSVSSQSGSADVLAAMGIPLDKSPDQIIESIEKIGFGFFFAPQFHPVVAKVKDIRKRIGVATVFNLLGPLAHPARVKNQLLGVYDGRKARSIAETLRMLGIQNAMVLHSEDGLDEFSLCAPTRIIQLKDETLSEFTLTPADFGLEPCELKDLKGGDAQHNAKILEDILEGRDQGPKRNIVLANTALGLVLMNKAHNWKEAFQKALAAIQSGNTAQTLLKLRSI